jgi:hypothetical protein
MDFSYHSLTKLFEIEKYRSSPFIQLKCDTVKEKYPNKYPIYLKASKVLDCIHTLLESKKLQPIDKEIDRTIDKIINIPNFESYSASNLLQQINPDPVVQAYNVPITHGKLNTIKRVTQPQNLHLNSCFRQQPSLSTDFDIILPREITHVSSMRLASIELPNTRLLISKKQNNNSFQIRLNSDMYNFEVPDGNYTSTTLINTLNDLLSHANNTVDTELAFKIDDQLHITLTTRIDPTPITFTFYPKSIGWMLGFRQSLYEYVETVISEGLFDAMGDRYVYLSVEDYQYNTNVNNIVCLDKSYIDKSILAKIPTNDEKFSLIIYDSDPLSKKRIYNGPVTLKKFHITLLDKFCRVIDLQQMDFSFTLELELIYENF